MSVWHQLPSRWTPSVHIRDIRLGGQIHNNKMEHVNGEFRDREKVMSGLKRMDTPILKGTLICRIKPHQGLHGRTPAEAAGIKVERGLVEDLDSKRLCQAF